MSDIKYMKAVEFDKLPAGFKKKYVSLDVLESKGYWLQKKYDGCFGKAYIDIDRDKCYMQSRTGEDYSVSCGHILDALHELACDSGAFDPFILLGEVWAEGVPFPDISGMFRRQSKGRQLPLCFVLNDMLGPDMETDYSYEKRWEWLEEFILEGEPKRPLMLASTYKAGAWSNARALALAWQGAGGYDGAILRNPSAGYTFGLVKNGEIIKVKPLLELDLRVAEAVVEKGEKTGRNVYTLAVDYRGVRSMVGSGVPHDVNKVPRPGYIVRIDSLGLTEDGKLREPRYIGIRHDKTEPDA